MAVSRRPRRWACPACDSLRRCEELREVGRIGSVPICLYRCLECGVRYFHPRPPPPPSEPSPPRFDLGGLRDARSPESWGAARVAGAYRAVVLAHKTRRQLSVVRSVARLGPDAPVLDIGCGAGLFLNAVHRASSSPVVGVEPRAAACDVARRLCPAAELHAVPLEAAPLPARRFAVATLWSTLEHLDAPLAALRLLRERLRVDGALVVEVPDAGCRVARMLGARWPALEPGDHVVHYDRGSLAGTLERAGFRVVEIRRLHTAGWQLHQSACLVAALREGREPCLEERFWRLERRSAALRLATIVGGAAAGALERRWLGPSRLVAVAAVR